MLSKIIHPTLSPRISAEFQATQGEHGYLIQPTAKTHGWDVTSWKASYDFVWKGVDWAQLSATHRGLLVHLQIFKHHGRFVVLQDVRNLVLGSEHLIKNFPVTQHSPAVRYQPNQTAQTCSRLSKQWLWGRNFHPRWNTTCAPVASIKHSG